MKELSQKLERLIETAVEKEEIAGANIVVIRDGQEMAFAADGYADIEAGKKYERDTIARLYSMTKPVTSAAAMLLMERGLLDPGAFVEEFLPGFHNAIVASGGKLVPTVRPVRICDLLNMTSGLMYGGDVTSVCSMETEKLFDRIKTFISGGCDDNAGGCKPSWIDTASVPAGREFPVWNLCRCAWGGY